MKVHKEIYRKLLRLIPDMDKIPISKDPILFEKDGAVPLNVHITERGAGETVLNLCQYPRSERGELVPSPDVEIRLDHLKKEAVPTVYIDLNGRVGLDEDYRKDKREAAMQKDKAVYVWLAALERQGFKRAGQSLEIC